MKPEVRATTIGVDGLRETKIAKEKSGKRSGIKG